MNHWIISCFLLLGLCFPSSLFAEELFTEDPPPKVAVPPPQIKPKAPKAKKTRAAKPKARAPKKPAVKKAYSPKPRENEFKFLIMGNSGYQSHKVTAYEVDESGNNIPTDYANYRIPLQGVSLQVLSVAEYGGATTLTLKYNQGTVPGYTTLSENTIEPGKFTTGSIHLGLFTSTAYSYFQADSWAFHMGVGLQSINYQYHETGKGDYIHQAVVPGFGLQGVYSFTDWFHLNFGADLYYSRKRLPWVEEAKLSGYQLEIFDSYLGVGTSF